MAFRLLQKTPTFVMLRLKLCLVVIVLFVALTLVTVDLLLFCSPDVNYENSKLKLSITKPSQPFLAELL